MRMHETFVCTKFCSTEDICLCCPVIPNIIINMPRSMKMPDSKQSAIEIMKDFTEKAYLTSYKDFFEKAVQILYGDEFIVKIDFSKRMLFSCQLCSKDMNNEVALIQHSHSGSHQKNLDRKFREVHKDSLYKQDIKFHRRDRPQYNPDTLQSMLMTSQVKPVGLQMVEVYEKMYHSWSYYKCNLCGAHGRLEAIYKHIIGNRHTEKYIKSRVILKTSFVTAKEREFIRDFLVKEEGIPVSAIKIYKDASLYPIKWERHNPSQAVMKKKQEAERELLGTSQSSFASRPSCSSSPDELPEYSQKIERTSSMCHTQKEYSENNPKEESSLSMFQNQFPPPPPPLTNIRPETSGDTQARTPLQTKEDIIKQDKSTQKNDLEELMVQLNFIVKTSYSPDFDIHTTEDAKAALEMMFRISSALHFIAKKNIENSTDLSQDLIDSLNHRKNLLSKIMGSIKLRMEAALLGKLGT
ncbi:uncharacterized protein LOC123505692 isoform X2 [Portunus trituberculatus]|uniref:uncharacterized protein LOC123505692 isoform X2 n=1 Tax=Portunus trituberculatus TaxID=210409 RepID=UPI001E1CC0D3|nr:uncharacterized protein LOC123505692 isoform X2 [Portunus trituberculatus]